MRTGLYTCPFATIGRSREHMRRSKVNWSLLGRVAIAFVALIALVGIALQAKAAFPASPSSTVSTTVSNQSTGIIGPIVVQEEKHDLSPRFDSIPPAPA